MILASLQRESGGLRWRRWYAPLVVAVALIADYGSPAEMWTAILPLAFMAVLLTFRERTAALAVLFLSSWILLPAAAGVASSYDAARGTRRLYGVELVTPGLEAGEYAECYASEFTLTPLFKEGGESAPARMVVRAVGSFAALYNQLAVWHVHHGEACVPAATTLDL
jgi:hypothetical protein